MTETPTGGWQGEGPEAHLQLTPEENRTAIARWQRAQAARGRLDSMMKTIQQGTAETHGSRLEGLEHSLKGLDSFRRKAATAADRGVSVEATGRKVEDLNRYTMSFPPETYTEGTKRAYEQLREHGYEPIPGKEQNLWEDPVYKGVNTSWQNAETQEKFELQFHTPDSFRIKSETHELYELARSGVFEEITEGNQEQADEYKAASDILQNEYYQDIDIPPGVEQLAERKVRATLDPGVRPHIIEEVRTMEAELKAENAAKAESARQEPGAEISPEVSEDLSELLRDDGPSPLDRLKPSAQQEPAPSALPAVELPQQNLGQAPKGPRL
ncbi:hypothetical protein ACFYYR_11250 [Streptomyces sp. NPDC001922]|uniref:hypothetical protein n=1 Tax=Streptomyces sp. NPDC001922 TaxID=3364624 RepID=UPI0036AB11BC